MRGFKNLLATFFSFVLVLFIGVTNAKYTSTSSGLISNISFTDLSLTDAPFIIEDSNLQSGNLWGGEDENGNVSSPSSIGGGTYGLGTLGKLLFEAKNKSGSPKLIVFEFSFCLPSLSFLDGEMDFQLTNNTLIGEDSTCQISGEFVRNGVGSDNTAKPNAVLTQNNKDAWTGYTRFDGVINPYDLLSQGGWNQDKIDLLEKAFVMDDNDVFTFNLSITYSRGNSLFSCFASVVMKAIDYTRPSL